MSQSVDFSKACASLGRKSTGPVYCSKDKLACKVNRHYQYRNTMVNSDLKDLYRLKRSVVHLADPHGRYVYNVQANDIHPLLHAIGGWSVPSWLIMTELQMFIRDEEDVHAHRPSNRQDKIRQDKTEDERKLRHVRVVFELAPSLAPTTLPDRGTRRTSTEPFASTNNRSI
ncbi:hypothetical protein PoB_003434700 [Plakobranchus ocellatus]|uniref:Uncharacterized protein n=1 Tax=Plakobranchus ocellatus TaxID=259542 RepID=A0AAV4ALN7_9GAST|nr:hypothetical protein PoB_003434700 [Plakobranchus ocellatus]